MPVILGWQLINIHHKTQITLKFTNLAPKLTMNKITLVGSFLGEDIMNRYYQMASKTSAFYLRIPDEFFFEGKFDETLYSVYTHATQLNKEWYIAPKGSNVAEWMGEDSPLINQCFSVVLGE